MTSTNKDHPDNLPEHQHSPALMAPESAMIALKHPHSNAVAWVMTGVYFLALFAAVPLLALLVFLTLPLGVGIDHPRRALHLWTTGLVASGVFISHAREQVQAWGGLQAAWSTSPGLTGLLVGGAMLGVLAILWHLSWVDSPLSQQRRG